MTHVSTCSFLGMMPLLRSEAGDGAEGHGFNHGDAECDY